jgi:hypothetical protein
MYQKLRYKMSKRMRPLEGPKELRNQPFLLFIKYITQKQFIWKVIPLHMKKLWEALTHRNGWRPWKMK